MLIFWIFALIRDESKCQNWDVLRSGSSVLLIFTEKLTLIARITLIILKTAELLPVFRLQLGYLKLSISLRTVLNWA